MAKVKVATMMNFLLQKMGVKPDVINTIVETITQEFDEEIEGSTEQFFKSLKTAKEFESDTELTKKFVSQGKAEAFNGFESNVLQPELPNLSASQREEYAKKGNVTEKFKYLMACIKANGGTAKDIQDIQAKVLEYERKVNEGELVDKAEVEKHKGVIKDLKLSTHYNGISSSLKQKGIAKSIAEDPDADILIRAKVNSFEKKKGISYDPEQQKYVDGDGNIVKRPNSVKHYEVDDFITDFIGANPNMIKKSEEVPADNITVKGGQDVKPDANEEKIREENNKRLGRV